MYCKFCGKIITDDSAFCRHCGKMLHVTPLHKFDTASKADKVTCNKNNNVRSDSNSKRKGRSRLGAIFILSITISIICTLGYALIRYEDSQPRDNTHYWGSSAYDPDVICGGNIEYVYEELNYTRKQKYEEGIKRIAIYSFPIAFGVLVIGAIITGTMKKKH